MSEIKEIPLSKLDPNPFRDGSGGTPPATWDSVAEGYGFDEQKLEELQASYKINGVWAGIIVRPAGARFQLTFGHHRVEAARRLGIKALAVILEPLSDDQMLQRMAAENSEEYGHDFSLGVMNAVEAVVKAFGAGLIKLEGLATGQGAQNRDWRVAPRFARGEALLDKEGKPLYTTNTVARYLGWVKKSSENKSGETAQERVWLALNALELIELGALKRTQLKGLGASQARELISITRRKMDSEKEKLAAQRESLEKARKAAERDDDKRKIAAINKKVEDLISDAPKLIKSAGQQAAGTITSYFKETKSMVEAAARAAEELNVTKTRPLAKPKVSDRNALADIDYFTERLDGLLKGDDPGWLKVLRTADEQGYKKTIRELDEALGRLAARVELRAGELRKAAKA